MVEINDIWAKLVASSSKDCVQVYNLNLERPPEDFLQLSAGTVIARKIAGCTAAFEINARVPHGPWRRPSKEELRLLISNSPPRQMGNSVALFRLSDALLRILRELSVEEIDTAAGPVAADNEMQQLLLSYIKPFCNVEGDAVCHGLISSPPNLITVSFDPKARLYNGMHTDSWDSPPGHNRNMSPNRISINVGTDERAFLFVNLTLDQMVLQLEQATRRPTPLPPGTAFGQHFLHTFPEYPIVRLRVRPGEAYIAPTENILHDGSTEGSRDTSWNITFRGNISPVINK